MKVLGYFSDGVPEQFELMCSFEAAQRKMQQEYPGKDIQLWQLESVPDQQQSSKRGGPKHSGVYQRGDVSVSDVTWDSSKPSCFPLICLN